MKVAVVQLSAGSDKANNVARAVVFVKEAVRNGAQFICLPEVFVYRGRVDRARIFKEIAETLPGPSTEPFAEIARQKKIWILAGSIFEKVPGQDRAYNSAGLFGPTGRILGKYRKINLFEARVSGRAIREEKNFLAGKKLFSSRIREFKVGVSICYDLRFPEIYQEYRRQGCQVFAVPSAFTQKTGKAHWEILARSRAVENLSYLLGPNQVGADERGIEAYGHSLIVNPWGEIIARASADQEEIIYADIDLKEVKRVRKILPSLFKYR